MSNKEQRKAPVLRFKGFTDDWEQRKFSDIAQRISTNININLPNVTYDDIDSENETLNKGIKNLSSGKKGILFQKNDILFGKLRPYLNNIIKVDFKGIAVGDFWVLRAYEDSSFLFSLINTPQYKYIANISSGSKMPRSDWNLVSKYLFCIPSEKEQSHIGNLILKLSQLITLQQRKLDKLKEIKGFYLSKMFPVKEKIVPVLRFANFVDLSWKKQKLGDVGKAKTGIGFPNQEQGGKEGIPFYKVSDMNNPGNETTMISSNNYVSVEQIKRNGWNIIKDVPAIFFAKVGAAVLLNRKRICKVPFLLDNNTMAYCMNQSYLDPQFTKILFETINLPSLTQMGALPSYNASDIESFSVNIPSMTEQKRIAKLFYDVDNLIIDQKKKIKKLKQTKKFLLQNMFI